MFSSKTFVQNLPKLYVLIVFLGFNFQLKADQDLQVQDTVKNNTFTLSGQYRPRFEVRQGTFRPLLDKEKPAVLVSDRVRLTFDYTHKNKVTLKITPQAVNIWGQTNMTQSAGNSGSKFSIFEAWAQIYASQAWSFKMGRQIISLDDERFFGELDWAQGGRVHDALSVFFTKNKLDLRGYFAYNQNYRELYNNNINNPSGNLFSTTDALTYKWMQTIWAAFRIQERSKITFLATNLGFQHALSANNDTVTNFSQTFGTNYSYTSEKLTANVSGYYQMGKDLSNVEKQAYLAHVAVGYNITSKWNVGLASDLVSGNDVGSTKNTSNIFTPYFHTGHKFYGFMDYFYVGNAHKNVGLSDSYLKLNFKTDKGLALNLAIHQFFTPNKIADATQEYSKNLGQEVDLGFLYKINTFATLMGGYSVYVANPSINFLKNTKDAKSFQQWFWLSVNVTPTFFKAVY